MLLPAKVSFVDPVHKEVVVGQLAMVSMAVAAVANIMFGLLSDALHAILGKRLPWVVFGSLGSSLATLLLISGQTVGELFIYWSLYHLFLNAIVAPIMAIIADLVPSAARGTVSALYSLGSMVGGSLSVVISAHYIGSANQLGIGLAICAIAVGACAPVAYIAIREPKLPKRKSLSLEFRRSIWGKLRIPAVGAKNYYLVLLGKLLVIAATSMVSVFQLYIVTDYVGLSVVETSATRECNGIDWARWRGTLFGCGGAPFRHFSKT